MADRSTIEWTDATWNPITGCSVVSPGCTNCYAMTLAGTRLRNHPSRAGLTTDTKAGPVWNGDVRFNEQWLLQPIQWARPRMIFVCAHGDLFHPAVPDAWIDRVFAVMAFVPQHVLQVLTKRSARARAYLSDDGTRKRVQAQCHDLGVDTTGRRMSVAKAEEAEEFVALSTTQWPLPNVWLGVSAEDQTRADERVPDLLATPAAVRWVSAEPLLGPIDFTRLGSLTTIQSAFPARITEEKSNRPSQGDGSVSGAQIDAIGSALSSILFFQTPDHMGGFTAISPRAWPSLDWIVVGGESGPGARPMHPQWARDIRDQCAAAGVAFHFKQWGSWKPISAMSEPENDSLYRSNRIAHGHESQEACDEHYGRSCIVPTTAIGYGGVVGLDAFRVVDGHGGMQMYQVGKARAGRLLDGVEHNGMPAVLA